MQSVGDKQRSLLMLMVMQLCTGFSMGIISPILGLFVRSQGLSMTQIGLVGTASMLGWFIWEPIMGVVADRFNKRLMLAGALFFSTVLYALYPFVKTFTAFALLEFTKTSVLSAYSIPVKALAAELLPSKDRGRAYGRYMTVISVGGLISPLIGGYVSEVAGFNLPFYLAAGIGLLAIIAVFQIQYEEPAHNPESKTSDGVRSLLTAPILAIFSVRGLYFFNAGFSGSFLSIFLNESPHLLASESQVGAFFTMMRLAGAVSRSVLGDFCDRFGKRLMISLSLAGMGFSYMGLILFGGVFPMYVMGLLMGLFQAAADTSMMLHLISVMPKERSGLTMGLYSESENVGGVISTPTMGYLYQNFGGNHSLWLLSIVLLLNAGYSYVVISDTKDA